MGIRVVTNEHWDVLTDLFENVNQKASIISPFITDAPSEFLVAALESNPDMHCNIITRFYREDFINGASRLPALRSLIRAGAEVYALKGLHTKLYLLDDETALIGSANFTSGGFKSNIELSLMIQDEVSLLQELQMYYADMIDNIKKAGDYRLTLDMIDNEALRINTLRKARTKNRSITAKNLFRFGADVKKIEKAVSYNDSDTDTIQTILERKFLSQQDQDNATKRNTITIEMIEIVYSVAKDVFGGTVNYSYGKQLVNQRCGMDIGSVGNYFQSLKAMLEGSVSTRSISKMATRYFLEHIEMDYGFDALSCALDSCRKHAKYSAEHGKKAKGIESLVEEFSARFP